MTKRRHTTKQTLIEALVNGFADKSEQEQEKALGASHLNRAERQSVRDGWKKQQAILSEKTLGLTPDELRRDSVFQKLVRQVRQDKCLLFLGAGVSIDVGIPGASQLVEALYAEADRNRWLDGGKRPQDYTLPDICEVVVKYGGKQALAGLLRRRFDAVTNSPKGVAPPHRRGAYRQIPLLTQLTRTILTTNWDDLLKLAFEDNGVECHPIRKDGDLHPHAQGLHEILRLHGDFSDYELLVATESDYEHLKDALEGKTEFVIGSLWGTAAGLMTRHGLIFVGYGLGDPDIALIQKLIARKSDREGYVDYWVDPNPQKQVINLFGNGRMQTIRASAGSFFTALTRELRQFANRTEDLKRIFDPSGNDFLELTAPFGSGKTALLDEVEQRALDSRWMPEQIVRIDVRPNGDGHPPVTRADLLKRFAEALRSTRDIRNVQELQQVLKDRQRVLVMVDSIENLEKCPQDVRDLIARDITQALEELIEADNDCCLILCGRYPILWNFPLKNVYRPDYLSHFDQKAVREMALFYLKTVDARSAEPIPTSLVQQIYELTGKSHPGFIKDILSDLVANSLDRNGEIHLPTKLTRSQCRKYLRGFSARIDSEVWNAADGSDAPLSNLFSGCLCLLHQVDSTVLSELARTPTFGPLFKGMEAKKIFDLLLAHHVLYFESSSYYLDRLIRRIKSGDLYYRDTRQAAQFHDVIASAYFKLQGRMMDDIQERYLAEWLYHRARQLQLLYSDPHKRWQQFRPEVDRITFQTQQKDPDMGDQMVKRLEVWTGGERELYDELFQCFGGDEYEQLCQLFRQKSPRRKK